MVQKIADDLMRLKPRERIELAESLILSVPEFATPEIDADWKREIKSRLADYDSGKVKSISSRSVHAEISRKLNETKTRRVPSRRAS
ncbi:MAG: addiction module protein [Limisphaerales bacterium]